MKAESLYHLLQIRARKLEEGADPALQRQLRAVQADLKVSHSRGWFEVTWRHAGRDFSLNVPEHDFTFYVAGDTAKAVEQRGVIGSVRLRNWQAAAALWQRLAEVSGFEIPPENTGGEMGLTPAVAQLSRLKAPPLVAAAIVAGIGSIATGIHAGWISSIGAGVVALLLVALTPFLLDTQLRRAFSLPELVIIAVGAFLPTLFAGSSLWLLPLLGGLLVMAWLESAQMDLPIAWALGGLLTAASAIWLGFAALLPVLALGGALLTLRLLTFRRITGGDAGWFLAGGVFGLIAALAAGSRPVAAADGSMAAPAAAGIVLLLAFSLWSFHGMLFRLVPWLAIGTLGLASLASLLAGPAMAAGSLAVSGFAVIIAKRVLAAFAGAAMTRSAVPAKAIKD